MSMTMTYLQDIFSFFFHSSCGFYSLRLLCHESITVRKQKELWLVMKSLVTLRHLWLSWNTSFNYAHKPYSHFLFFLIVFHLAQLFFFVFFLLLSSKRVIFKMLVESLYFTVHSTHTLYYNTWAYIVVQSYQSAHLLNSGYAEVQKLLIPALCVKVAKSLFGAIHLSINSKNFKLNAS